MKALCSYCGMLLTPKHRCLGVNQFVERSYTPRVRYFEIENDDGFYKIARWSKKDGLMWRVEKFRNYGFDELSKYWKVKDASAEGISKAMRSVGEYLTAKQISDEDACKLLDLLAEALSSKLPK